MIVDAHVHLFPERVFEAIWHWFDKHAWNIRYRLHAEEVVEFLNAAFAFMIESIDRHGGFINKFLGDGLLALFGAPLPPRAGRNRCYRRRAQNVSAERSCRAVPDRRLGVYISMMRTWASRWRKSARSLVITDWSRRRALSTTLALIGS